MEDWRTVLGATVDMRRDANRRTVEALDNNDNDAYNASRKLHKDAEKIARAHRMKS